MATKLAGERGKDYRRGDMYHFDPTKVHVRNDLRGRWKAPTERDILELAISFFLYGQIQPCEVRLVTVNGVANTPQLNSGFTRCAAARLLREGFTVPEDFKLEDLNEPENVEEASQDSKRFVAPGEFVQDSEFMLQVKAVRCDDRQALERNIEENRRRTDTSDIDDAYNQNTLREKYGYNDSEIARRYGYNNATKVSRLKKLLLLPDEIKMMVHDKRMATAAAIDLLDRPESEWEAIVAEAMKGDKVNGTDVRKIVREKNLSDFENAEEQNQAAVDAAAEAAEEAASGIVVGNSDSEEAPKPPKPPKPSTKPLTMSEFRKELARHATGDKQEYAYPELMQKAFDTLMLVLQGQRRFATFQNKLQDIAYADPSEFVMEDADEDVEGVEDVESEDELVEAA